MCQVFYHLLFKHATAKKKIYQNSIKKANKKKKTKGAEYDDDSKINI